MNQKILAYLVSIGVGAGCSAGLKSSKSKRSAGDGSPSTTGDPSQKAPDDPADAAEENPVFLARPPGLRTLSKAQIGFSLQNVLGLASPPPLGSVNETVGKLPIYRNALDIVPDAANLRALDREILAIVNGMDIRGVSQRLASCDALSSASCRPTFILKFAEAAWRRPLTTDEGNVLQSQVNQLGTTANLAPQNGLSLVIRGILYDPRFLYLSELGSGDAQAPGQPTTLTAWESLSSASYALTMRPPSKEIQARLAELGEHPEVLASLSDEMARSADFSLVVSDFLRQWTMVYGIETQVKGSVPEWNAGMGATMNASLDTFVRDVITQGGGIKDLMLSPTRDNNNALGVYGTAAFLTATSKTRHGSMIIRGVRLFRDALCQNMPSPPPSLDISPPINLDPSDPAYEEKLALSHGSKAACKGCHSSIDPIGLSLNLFNGLGQPASRIADFPALGLTPRVSVTLGSSTEDIATENGQSFGQSLAHSTVYRRCFGRNAMRYLIGRSLSGTEEGLADTLSDQYLATDSGGIQQFFHAIVNHPNFFVRISPL